MVIPTLVGIFGASDVELSVYCVYYFVYSAFHKHKYSRVLWMNQYIINKKDFPKEVLDIEGLKLDLICIGYVNQTVKFGPDYLLCIACHHTTSRGEIYWVIDQWGLDEWNVW